MFSKKPNDTDFAPFTSTDELREFLNRGQNLARPRAHEQILRLENNSRSRMAIHYLNGLGSDSDLKLPKIADVSTDELFIYIKGSENLKYLANLGINFAGSSSFRDHTNER